MICIWRTMHGLQCKKFNQAGFTVPELIVVMTLTLLFSTMVMSFAFDYWGITASLQNSNDTLVTRQNLGDTLRNRINVASNLLNQNSIIDPNAPESSSGEWPMLHAVPLTVLTPTPGQIKPILYYEAPVLDATKNFVMRGTSPHQNNFMLYLDGTTKQLLLRTLANEVTENVTKTTCPSSHIVAGCGADRVMADDVVSVSTKYFSKSGNALNHNDVIDPETGVAIGPDFPDVEVVELTINLKKRATIRGTADSSSQTTIRVALRNG